VEEVLGPSPARSTVSSAVGAARTPLELLLRKIGDFLRPSPARSTVSTPLELLLRNESGDFLRPWPVSSAVGATRTPLELLLRSGSGGFLRKALPRASACILAAATSISR
jgi:hypothetical protein